MFFAGRVEAVGRFVEHEQPGLGEQGGGEPEPLTHAEGEAAGLVVGDIGEPDLVEHVVDSRCPRVVASQSGQRGEVLPGGERGVEAGPVHEAGDAVGSGERAPERRAQDLEVAAVGDGQAQQETEQRRLAGAVRSDQAVDLALRHVQIDAVECHDVTETLGDPASLNCERCVHEPLLPKHSGTLGTAHNAGTGGWLNVQETDRQGVGKSGCTKWPASSQSWATPESTGSARTPSASNPSSPLEPATFIRGLAERLTHRHWRTAPRVPYSLDHTMTHANAPVSVEGRCRLIERCKTRPIAHVAAEMGISRATASKWINRHRRHGELGLIDRSSTPHHQPSATPVDVVTRIEEMRRAHKCSATRIAHELTVDGMVISRRTVTRHLAVLGLNRRKFIDPNGKTHREPRTITARRPGHMVHVDVKKAAGSPTVVAGVSTVAKVNRQRQSRAARARASAAATCTSIPPSTGHHPHRASRDRQWCLLPR